MKIKLDTPGLEKAARLAEKLNTKGTSASGPKAPNLSDYSQTVKNINALVDAQNRLQSAIIRTGNISPPAISSPSETELNRMREASKAYEELCTAVQKYNKISSSAPTVSGTGRTTTGNIQTDAPESTQPFKSVLNTGITALNTATKAIALKNNFKILSKEITTNLDQPKFLAATLP